MSPVEYVVQSKRGEAVVRTSDVAEAERWQRLLGGAVQQNVPEGCAA